MFLILMLLLDRGVGLLRSDVHIDLLEVNSWYHEDGSRCFTQLIAWEWASDMRCYTVSGWTMYQSESEVAAINLREVFNSSGQSIGARATMKGREIVSNMPTIRTYTMYDREREDFMRFGDNLRNFLIDSRIGIYVHYTQLMGWR